MFRLQQHGNATWACLSVMSCDQTLANMTDCRQNYHSEHLAPSNVALLAGAGPAQPPAYFQCCTAGRARTSIAPNLGAPVFQHVDQEGWPLWVSLPLLTQPHQVGHNSRGPGWSCAALGAASQPQVVRQTQPVNRQGEHARWGAPVNRLLHPAQVPLAICRRPYFTLSNIAHMNVNESMCRISLFSSNMSKHACLAEHVFVAS
jgi:hypothetical protein